MVRLARLDHAIPETSCIPKTVRGGGNVRMVRFVTFVTLEARNLSEDRCLLLAAALWQPHEGHEAHGMLSSP